MQHLSVFAESGRIGLFIKKMLSALLLIGISSLFLLLVAGLSEQAVNRFFMHPPEINECLNHDGTWFYELKGCSD